MESVRSVNELMKEMAQAIIQNASPEQLSEAGLIRSTDQTSGGRSELLTRKECCNILRISMTTFHKLVNEGKIEIKKIGSRTLVDSSSIDRFLNPSLTIRERR